MDVYNIAAIAAYQYQCVLLHHACPSLLTTLSVPLARRTGSLPTSPSRADAAGAAPAPRIREAALAVAARPRCRSRRAACGKQSPRPRSLPPIWNLTFGTIL